jgi:hypothetical protein
MKRWMDMLRQVNASSPTKGVSYASSRKVVCLSMTFLPPRERSPTHNFTYSAEKRSWFRTLLPWAEVKKQSFVKCVYIRNCMYADRNRSIGEYVSAVDLRRLTVTESCRILSQISLCGIWGAQNGAMAVFSLRISCFSVANNQQRLTTLQ